MQRGSMIPRRSALLGVADMRNVSAIAIRRCMLELAIAFVA